MVFSGGNVAIIMVLALLLMSPAIVSSFMYSNARWSSHLAVSRRRDSNNSRSPGGTRARSCRGTRGCRRELTCGLQITVRIRGKKSRDEDYTNQVRGRRGGKCYVVVALRGVNSRDGSNCSCSCLSNNSKRASGAFVRLLYV